MVCIAGYCLKFSFSLSSGKRYGVEEVIVRCLSGLNVHFCKKSQQLAQMTFDRYLSNPDIGRTCWGGLTPCN